MTLCAARPQQNALGAIAATEFALYVRTERQGLAGVELAEHLEELATTYNTVAMANVQANGDLAQELLRKAEMLTEQKELMCNRDVRVKLRAVTLNNMGCLYRRCATSAYWQLHWAAVLMLAFLRQARQVALRPQVPGESSEAGAGLDRS